MEEPAVNLDAGNFRVDLEGGEGDAGKGRTKNVRSYTMLRYMRIPAQERMRKPWTWQQRIFFQRD